MREWSHQALSDYAEHFGDEEKQAVLKRVTDYELLAELLSTTNGRLILDNSVNRIRNLTMDIIKLSVDGAEKNIKAIIQDALLIKVHHLFMQDMATIAKQGEEIVSQLKKE